MADETDVVARLRALCNHDRPVPVSVLKDAADEIERLRAVASPPRREQSDAAMWTFVNSKPPVTAQRFDEIDRRLALLESSVRLTARRLSATAAIMSESGDRYATRCSFAASVAVMVHKGLTADERDLPVEAVSE